MISFSLLGNVLVILFVCSRLYYISFHNLRWELMMTFRVPTLRIRCSLFSIIGMETLCTTIKCLEIMVWRSSPAGTLSRPWNNGFRRRRVCTPVTRQRPTDRYSRCQFLLHMPIYLKRHVIFIILRTYPTKSQKYDNSQ